MSINGHTQICLIVGEPVEHSLSPAMHNAAYEALGLDGDFVYVAARVAQGDLARAVAGVRSMGFRGLTCTIPHKTAILPLLDEVDPVAARIGAVNSVVQRAGRLCGYNTDWLGIVRPLEAHGTLAGKRAAVIGAGGTARAATFGLQERGCTVTLFNRTLANAEEIAAEAACEAYALDEISRVAQADIIVQTTSVGMTPHTEASLIPAALLKPGQLVLDAIYTPFATRLLQDAHAEGATALPGAQMFLHQGLAQFALYTEREAPRDVMTQVICAHFGVESLSLTRLGDCNP